MTKSVKLSLFISALLFGLGVLVQSFEINNVNYFPSISNWMLLYVPLYICGIFYIPLYIIFNKIKNKIKNKK